jgi:hypothetical protein
VPPPPPPERNAKKIHGTCAGNNASKHVDSSKVNDLVPAFVEVTSVNLASDGGAVEEPTDVHVGDENLSNIEHLSTDINENPQAVTDDITEIVNETNSHNAAQGSGRVANSPLVSTPNLAVANDPGAEMQMSDVEAVVNTSNNNYISKPDDASRNRVVGSDSNTPISSENRKLLVNQGGRRLVNNTADRSTPISTSSTGGISRATHVMSAPAKPVASVSHKADKQVPGCGK